MTDKQEQEHTHTHTHTHIYIYIYILPKYDKQKHLNLYLPIHLMDSSRGIMVGELD